MKITENNVIMKVVIFNLRIVVLNCEDKDSVDMVVFPDYEMLVSLDSITYLKEIKIGNSQNISKEVVVN